MVGAISLERSGGGDTFSRLSFGGDAFGRFFGFGLGMENQKGGAADESGMGGRSGHLSVAWGERGDGADQSSFREAGERAGVSQTGGKKSTGAAFYLSREGGGLTFRDGSKSVDQSSGCGCGRATVA